MKTQEAIDYYGSTKKLADALGLPAGRTPHREGNFLDMADQEKLKPQRKDVFGARATGLMEPQPGTIAFGDPASRSLTWAVPDAAEAVACGFASGVPC